jgi:DNA-3-methyladenine glycosylase II
VSRPFQVDEGSLAEAVAALAEVDADLAEILGRHGSPPLWAREAGFQTLLKIILEQQVTLESGQAAYDRLERAAGTIEAEAIIDLGEAGAREAGLTRQKARYVVEVARAVLDGRLDLHAVARASDDAARARLVAIPGIGDWTVDVYLLLALRRPDAWPRGDLALANSAQFVKRLPQRPTFAELDHLAESWRPWRSVAARMLWHSYLSGDRPRRSNGGTA